MLHLVPFTDIKYIPAEAEHRGFAHIKQCLGASVDIKVIARLDDENGQATLVRVSNRHDGSGRLPDIVLRVSVAGVSKLNE